MKIGIPVTRQDGKGNIDQHFGRCPYYAVIEIDSDEIVGINVIENTSAHQSGGAGITGSQLIANQGIDVIIAANMGPRAVEVFDQLDIELYRAEDDIESAVRDFIEGNLQRITSATGPSHQGMGRYGGR